MLECMPCVCGRVFEADLFSAWPSSSRTYEPSKFIARSGSHYSLKWYHCMFTCHSKSISFFEFCILRKARKHWRVFEEPGVVGPLDPPPPPSPAGSPKCVVFSRLFCFHSRPVCSPASFPPPGSLAAPRGRPQKTHRHLFNVQRFL